MADGAREHREAIRQRADLRRRLAAAEDALTDTLAAMKSAEGAYDAANDRFEAAERALDAAREERAVARQERYAARQAYEQASTTVDRVRRRIERLGDMPLGALAGQREPSRMRFAPGTGDLSLASSGHLALSAAVTGTPSCCCQ